MKTLKLDFYTKKLTTESFFKLLLYAQLEEVESLHALSDCLFDDQLQKGINLDSISISQFITIFPGIFLISPLFRFLSSIGAIDTYLALLIPYVAYFTPLVVWILTGFFKTIHPSIEEVAIMDGCTVTKIITKIILPLSIPGIIPGMNFYLR